MQPLCPASNLAIFSQVPLACAGRVLGADFCPNLEEIDQRLEVQVGVLTVLLAGHAVSETRAPGGECSQCYQERITLEIGVKRD